MYSEEFISLLNNVDNFVKENDGHVWFRGVGNSGYLLNSSLFRLKCSSLFEFQQYEKQFYNLAEVNQHVLEIHEKELELLYTMQHNGIRTRLLDWTGSLSVALFFTQWHWKPSHNARLWMLNPKKLNEIFHGKSGIISPQEYNFTKIQNLDKSIAIYPIKNTKRIIAQHGFFTIQGNAMTPLDKEDHGKLTKNNAIKYIDISFSLKQSIIDFLHICNIDYFTVYPDFEGLNEYIDNVIISPTLKEY
jgi:hypothetical protein